MKHAFLFFSLVLASQAFAAKVLVGQNANPRISNVSVVNRVEQVEVECYSDKESICFDKQVHPVVSIMVDYTVEQENHIDQIPEQTSYFKEYLDQSLFSQAELKALGDSDYQTRMNAAHNLLALKLTLSKTSSENLKVEVIKK